MQVVNSRDPQGGVRERSIGELELIVIKEGKRNLGGLLEKR